MSLSGLDTALWVCVAAVIFATVTQCLRLLADELRWRTDVHRLAVDANRLRVDRLRRLRMEEDAMNAPRNVSAAGTPRLEGSDADETSMYGEVDIIEEDDDAALAAAA